MHGQIRKVCPFLYTFPWGNAGEYRERREIHKGMTPNINRKDIG